MDKVKITRELADAIEGVIKHADENILYDVTYIKNVCEADKFDAPKLMPIYNYIQIVGFKEYFKVLVIGYEVEETPEDKVKLFYDKASEKKSNLLNCAIVSYDEVELQNGIMRGIEGTLGRLNIKIEGIN